MKNFVLLLALMISSFSFAKNETNVADPFYGSNPIIFIENNIEFAVYPDGQFDFFYQPAAPRGFYRNHNINISFNSGYNYNPFVQFDDYGAVIQIENTPVFYDYYGRIIQAGDVFINYNRFGRVSSIGNMRFFYNTNGHFLYRRGYINRFNRVYVVKPWHHYYMIPPAHYTIVYYEPYRYYYQPYRVSYVEYRDHYRSSHHNNVRSFYRPSEKVSNYTRGEMVTRRDNAIAENTRSSNTRRDVNTEVNANTRRNSISTSPRTRNTNTTRSTQPTRREVSPANNEVREIQRTDRRSLSVDTTLPTRRTGVSTPISNTRTNFSTTRNASSNRSATNTRTTNNRTRR
ncbi:hypothetical protein [Mesonia sp. K7]|uniref:hypothetical protein n=1 Tax=Mesonia sp. K7 TaxID=2218606 RepID=UPI000DAA624F|nr:hypothetical protein [Mesonia sp. K7]PZD79296.1 hypothetical protein DNG35_02085 [Mesonia sp. K7]